MANCENCVKSGVCKYYEPKSTVACEHYSEPVRHGHWVNENFYTRCSVCGKMAIYDKYGQEVESDYCPKCGARMDGDADANGNDNKTPET